MRVDVEQQRLVGRVEHAARADRHRADGVAVIAVLERDDARARLAAVAPSSRAPSSARPRPRSSRCRKRRRARGPAARSSTRAARQLLGRLVREAGEDHLIEPLGLLRDRGDDLRVAVAVRDHPPGRDRVEDARGRRARVEPGALGRGDLDGIAAASACWVKGCQTGRSDRSWALPPRKSIGGSCAAKAARSVAASSGSRRGSRPSRRTPPNAQIVRSVSGVSLADEGDAEHAELPRRRSASIDSRRVVDRAERGARARGRPAAPQRAKRSMQQRRRVSGTSSPPAPSTTSGPSRVRQGRARSGSISMPSQLGRDDAASSGVVRR